jgi:hypothetical protein
MRNRIHIFTMKQLTSFLAAGVFLAACATSSLADTEGPLTTSTPIPASLTEWSGTLLFPQFNPALGTLDSVELNLSSSLTTTLTIINDAASASSGTASTWEEITVQDPGLNLTAPFSVYSAGYVYSLGSGDSTSSGLLTGNGGSDLTYTLGTILTEFTGGGNISLNAGTLTYTLLSNYGGNTVSSQVTDAGLTGTVTYTYTAVPEPSTFGLLALGLSALPLLRRPRQ